MNITYIQEDKIIVSVSFKVWYNLPHVYILKSQLFQAIQKKGFGETDQRNIYLGMYSLDN